MPVSSVRTLVYLLSPQNVKADNVIQRLEMWLHVVVEDGLPGEVAAARAYVQVDTGQLPRGMNDK
jgi:hypothetical protein